jgi:hypothetical protein
MRMQHKEPIQKTLLSVQETAEVLGVSSDALSIWRIGTKGPAHVRIGSQVFYRRNDVENFITKG